MSVTVRRAASGDLPAIEELLREGNLPLDGVAPHLDGFVVAIQGDRVMGCAGLEVHGDACVLRSLAVTRAARGHGVVRPLIGAILTEAVGRGCREAYLLTHTIEPMARRYGFTPIARDAAPARILASGEFRLVRCQTAVLLRKDLDTTFKSRI
ncbi:MAG: GNAT family N-acetyltransferase [Candidatus Polarisedimenticolia bacterium]